MIEGKGLRGMNERSIKGGGMRLAALAFALAVALFACMALPAQAHATVNLGTVGVAVPESISLDSGQTGQVAVACDPAYSDQYPNCLNDYCPSGCDFGKEGDGVACEDKTGQCTCYGYKSARYYPSCTVSSSNPSVVRASWSDGMLSVSGYRAGTATLTVVPSLRLFSSLPATIQVEVTEPPAPEPAQPAQSASEKQGETPAPQATPAPKAKQAAPSASGGDASSGKGSVSASSTKSGKGSGSGAVAVTSSKGASSATSGSSGNTSGRSGAGTIVSVIEQADSGEQAAGDSAEVPEGTVSSDAVRKLEGKTAVGKDLAEAAGTTKVVTLWGGKDAESPDFMLVVAGANIPVDVDEKLEIDVHEADDKQLAEQLGGIEYAAFTIDGVKKLPCTTQVFWRTTNAFANGKVVNVYHFDRESGTFKKIHKNIKTGEGYACFNVIDGGEYVIAERDDLDAKTSEAERAADDEKAASDGAGSAPQAKSEGTKDAEGPVSAEDGATAGQGSSEAGAGDAGDASPLKKMPPWSAPVGATAAVAAAGVATYSVRRKNAAAAASSAAGDAAGSASPDGDGDGSNG
jgi:hypothetical protein